MIKGLTGGKGVVINGGNTPTTYINMSNPSAGMMRYNGNSNNIEVYDGSSWMTMQTSYASVELDAETLSLIDWARKKRAEEYELEILAEKNPTIKDLVDKVKLYKNQIKMVQTLLNSPGDDGEVMQEPMRP